MQKVSTWIRSPHKQITRIRDGRPLRHSGIFSNWDNTWMHIQNKDDSIFSLIRNIMEHYSCRHRKKHLFHDYELYGNLLPQSCVNNIWNFIHEYVISLLSSPTQVNLHREEDIFIMEQFSHSVFMPRELKNLNRCQLYLQIHTLSEISNGHGAYFEKRYDDGHQH